MRRTRLNSPSSKSTHNNQKGPRQNGKCYPSNGRAETVSTRTQRHRQVGDPSRQRNTAATKHQFYTPSALNPHKPRRYHLGLSTFKRPLSPIVSAPPWLECVTRTTTGAPSPTWICSPIQFSFNPRHHHPIKVMTSAGSKDMKQGNAAKINGSIYQAT